jgi:phosphate transport system protein|tara:strand:+ start:4789 stop:5502 length:714 start_codon:yes stop_codon:yes gene_type:complete
MEHIVKSYDAELQALKQTLIRMGGLVESQLDKAMTALSSRNSELAKEVIANDKELDALDAEVSEQVIQMIAKRQPIADDLRRVISSLRISADLERMGDYSANVAKRVVALNQLPAMQPAHSIPRMGQLVQANTKRVLDAFVKGDPNLALNVWESDEEIDETYTSLFRETLTYMMEDPRNITPCTHLLFIAKNVERMGDHATNVAEEVYFRVTGKKIEGGRPKGDTSSFEVLKDPENK